MTTTTRNEAAERLRDWAAGDDDAPVFRDVLDEALAAERKATVERIRERLYSKPLTAQHVAAILDEEAAR